MDKKRIMQNKTEVELENDKLKKKLKILVDKFKDENGWSKYEEHIQTSFTIKLLELLGWNSSDWMINSPQDVKTGKKPDIVLKSPASKLLVIESKDAHKKDMLDGAYQNKTFVEQLLKYCSGEGVAWGVLTNFVEWRLYSVHPTGRLYNNKKYAFYDLLWPNASRENYVDLLSDDGLNFLAKLSKESLFFNQGRIDRATIYYPVQQDLAVEKIKRQFFEKIKGWRSSLRKDLLKNYPRIEKDKAGEIDLLAQRILDRLIFMDICHDKNVIGEDIIGQIKESKLFKYEELKIKFKQMDEKFNTELFTFKDYRQIKEEDIKINDGVILPIITDLIDIDFSKLSVHIIGEVYENYLGELAKSRITDEKKISDKQKQKRKSQGIYYTPDYIVDYIVKNTVGELLAKVKTTAEIEKIRVLDPACGSGSFLIRAFDEFYNTYRRIYKVNIGQTMSDEFDIKRKILQNNIFGVDLDAKAVEITKLNLMIKTLEGVKPEDLKGKHLLPNLNLNIRCGNSLIGGEKLSDGKLDLYNYQKEIGELIELKNQFHKENDNEKKKELLQKIDAKEEFINGKLNEGLKQYFKNLDKVDPFNYTVAFCEIFKDGGFDAVIGNPPYVKEYENRKIFEEAKVVMPQYYMGKMDIWYFFASKATDLLKDGGYHSFIAQNNWITSYGAKKLREKILSDSKIISFFDFNDYKVFADAGIQTMIYVVQKKRISKSYDVNYSKVTQKDLDIQALRNALSGVKVEGVFNFSASISPKKTEESINFVNSDADKILNKIKIKANFRLLEDEVAQGIIGGPDKAFLYDLNLNFTNSEKLFLHKHYTNAGKYYLGSIDNLISYLTKSNIKNIDKDNYSNFYSNLLKFKKQLENRRENKSGQIKFFHLHWPRDEKFFRKGKKVACPTRTFKPAFYYTEDEYYASRALNIIVSDRIDLKYLTAILNSNLVYFWLKNKGKMLGDMLQIDKGFLLNIPIYAPNLNDDKEKKIYNNIFDLVDEMLKLNKTSESREKNKTRIEAVDYEIDQLVYKLYGLNEEEIKIVEDHHLSRGAGLRMTGK